MEVSLKKVNLVTTKQQWKDIKNSVENADFIPAFKRLISRAKDTCLFDVSSLSYGIAYCYNNSSGASDSDSKKQSRKVTAYAFVNTTSELSANDILDGSGVTKNESLQSGKTSSKNAAAKKTIKVAIGR